MVAKLCVLLSVAAVVQLTQILYRTIDKSMLFFPVLCTTGVKCTLQIKTLSIFFSALYFHTSKFHTIPHKITSLLHHKNDCSFFQTGQTVQSATTIKGLLITKLHQNRCKQYKTYCTNTDRLDRQTCTRPQDDLLERPKYGQALNLSVY